jgi:hypothetical protein
MTRIKLFEKQRNDEQHITVQDFPFIDWDLVCNSITYEHMFHPNELTCAWTDMQY